MSADHLRWTDVSVREVYNARIFTLENVTRRAAGGREAEFVRIASPDWVNVIALTRNDSGQECLVMVRQYRHGAADITLEIPGGLVDEGEDPEVAVARELVEETGYQADRLILLGETNPNPAFMTNTVYTFLADGVEQVAGQSLDEHELVDFELVPVTEILALSRPEFNRHAIMLAALSWFRRWYDEHR